MSNDNVDAAATDFQPFPAARVQQIEQRQKESQPFRDLPSAGPKRAGQNMQVNGMNTGLPIQRDGVSAQHLDLPETVAVESPNFTRAIAEPEAVVLELPSRYAFYAFKDLYVKPFKGYHLGKLSRAREEHSLLHMVEVVSSVLSTTSGEQAIGYMLTLQDFYFVLYWLRLNSYTKSVFLHTSSCVNPVHISDVTAGKVLADTLQHTEVIRKSTLKTIMLDEIPNPEKFVLEYPGIEVASPTMQGIIEMTENDHFSDPEFRFLAQKAVYIKTPQPTTLAERIAIVNDMSPDDISTIDDYETALSHYGIEEKINVTCKHCGHTKVDDISINAHSFFR